MISPADLPRQGGALGVVPNIQSAIPKVHPHDDDRDTLDRLYRRYHPDIRALCYRLIGDTVRADELAQETFVRVLAHADAIDPSRPAWPWLSTIARRLCIDHLRSRRPEVRSTDGTEPFDVRTVILDGAADPTGDLVVRRTEGERARLALTAALTTLSARDRRILWLRDVESWNYEDIAGAVGSSVHSVRNLAWRARNRVRAFLIDAKWGVPALGPATLSSSGLRSAVTDLLAHGAHLLRRFRGGASRLAMALQERARPGTGELASAMIPSLGTALIALISTLAALLPGTGTTTTPTASAARQSARAVETASGIDVTGTTRHLAGNLSHQRRFVPPAPLP